MGSFPTLAELFSDFHDSTLTSVILTARCLERIADPAGEGARAFTAFQPDVALEAARVSDQLRAAGTLLSPIMGLPISVKDLFDVAGQPTHAGSVVLQGSPPAKKDAAAVARLRKAGAVLIGRTTMTEFAYSGVGLNPHYGTPASPFDRETRRIPGGSSSGGGVSVADGMAAAALGTDTGGSVRIPAALCGLTGFKPTARRVPTNGAFSLSMTYDSIGPIAPSVACCITLDQVLSGTPIEGLDPFPINNLRFAVVRGIPQENLDNTVSAAFERALDTLSQAGAHVHDVSVPAINHPDRAAFGAQLLMSEAYAIHRSMLNEKKNQYDPRVAARMLPAAELSAADYIDLLGWRTHFLRDTHETLHPYDAILMPTTPQVAPPIADLEASDEVYYATNRAMLRNTSIINQVDGCALSIPCHHPGEAPNGLMVAGLPMQDEKILRIGLTVEAFLSPKFL